MSRYVAKLFKSPLVLASASLAIHVSAATAADGKGDIQQQMRDLLTGTPTTHFVPPSRPRDGKAVTPAGESQEFVKQLLLGTAAYRHGAAETSKRPDASGASGKSEAQRRSVVSVDMQASVRELLLGQPGAKDAS